MRSLVLALVALPLLAACSHYPSANVHAPPPLCTNGTVFLYFQSDTPTLAASFGSGFGVLTRVVDRCEVDEISVAGLPDPKSPEAVNTLAGRRAETVQTLFALYDIPVTFRVGDEDDRAQPSVGYIARPGR